MFVIMIRLADKTEDLKNCHVLPEAYFGPSPNSTFCGNAWAARADTFSKGHDHCWFDRVAFLGTQPPDDFWSCLSLRLG